MELYYTKIGYKKIEILVHFMIMYRLDLNSTIYFEHIFLFSYLSNVPFLVLQKRINIILTIFFYFSNHCVLLLYPFFINPDYKTDFITKIYHVETNENEKRVPNFTWRSEWVARNVFICWDAARSIVRFDLSSNLLNRYVRLYILISLRLPSTF